MNIFYTYYKNEMVYSKVFVRAVVATLGFTGFSYLFKKVGIDDGVVITTGNVIRAYLPALCTVALVELIAK